MTWHMRAHEALGKLGLTLRMYDGIVAELHDNELRVTRWQPEGERRETITCSPRPSDRDTLWFWASDRRPLGEAENFTDVALVVAGRLGHHPRNDAR